MNIFKLTKKDWLDCVVLFVVYSIFYILFNMLGVTSEWNGLAVFFFYAFGKASMLE
jgi:hypothetical protein